MTLFKNFCPPMIDLYLDFLARSHKLLSTALHESCKKNVHQPYQQWSCVWQRERSNVPKMSKKGSEVNTGLHNHKLRHMIMQHFSQFTHMWARCIYFSLADGTQTKHIKFLCHTASFMSWHFLTL